jgi:hypothetical protein
MPEPIFMKLCMYIMEPEPISTAYFINPSQKSVCLYVYPPFVARQRLGTNVTAATNTHAMEELLARRFLRGPCRIRGKYTISSSQNVLFYACGGVRLSPLIYYSGHKLSPYPLFCPVNFIIFPCTALIWSRTLKWVVSKGQQMDKTFEINISTFLVTVSTRNLSKNALL